MSLLDPVKCRTHTSDNSPNFF